MRRRKLNDIKNKIIEALKNPNNTYNKISKYVGYKGYRATIISELVDKLIEKKEIDPKLRRIYGTFTEGQLEVILNNLSKKRDLNEISKDSGVKYSIIKKIADSNVKTSSEVKDILLNRKKIPTREQLEFLYHKMRKTTQEIGDIFGVTNTAVSYWLSKNGIQARSTSEANFVRFRKDPHSLNNNLIKKLFLQDNKNSIEISRILGVSSSTILKRLTKMGIRAEDYTDYNQKRPPKRELEYLYLQQKKSLKEIAEIIGGVNHWVVSSWLKNYNIPKRSPRAARLAFLKKDVEKPQRDKLYEIYIKEDKTTRQLAKIFGVGCSTINRWLKIDNIKKGRKSKYFDKNYRREICDRIINYLNKSPEQFAVSDFAQVEKKLGKNYSGILKFYGTHYNLITNCERMNKLVEDLYNKKRILPKKETYNEQNIKYIIDKVLVAVNKKPSQLSSADFGKAKKKLGKDYSGVLTYYMKKNKLNTIPKAIERILGEQYGICIRELERKRDYCKNLDELTTEISNLIGELGHFPTTTELKDRGLNNLLYSIMNYHGGMDNVRKIMGHKPLRKPNKYWADKDNLRKELEPIIKELGRFPTSKELIVKGFGIISAAIQQYHGGMDKIRELMGYARIAKKDYSLEEGLEEYSNYLKKCKADGKKPTTLRNFFYKYNLQDFEPTSNGGGFLVKYIQRYQKEKKKLEEKVE